MPPFAYEVAFKLLKHKSALLFVAKVLPKLLLTAAASVQISSVQVQTACAPVQKTSAPVQASIGGRGIAAHPQALAPPPHERN